MNIMSMLDDAADETKNAIKEARKRAQEDERTAQEDEQTAQGGDSKQPKDGDGGEPVANLE